MKKLLSIILASVILVSSIFSSGIIVNAVSYDATIKTSDGDCYAKKGDILYYYATLSTDALAENGQFNLNFPDKLLRINDIYTDIDGTQISQPGKSSPASMNWSMIKGVDLTDGLDIFGVEFEVIGNGTGEISVDKIVLSEAKTSKPIENFTISEYIYNASEDSDEPEEPVVTEPISPTTSTEPPTEDKSDNLSNGDIKHVIKGYWEYGSLNPQNASPIMDGDNRYVRTDYINVSSYNSVELNVSDTSNKYLYFQFDKDKKLVVPAVSIDKSATFNISEKTKYIRVLANNANGLELNDFNSAKPPIEIYGKNITFSLTSSTSYDDSYYWEQGNISYSSGEDAENETSNCFRTSLITIKDSVKSVLCNPLATGVKYNIFWYNSNKALISTASKKTEPSITETHQYDKPEAAKYVRVVILKDSETLSINNIEKSQYILLKGASSSSQETSSSVEWERGRLNYKTGEEIEETEEVKAYYRTKFIPTGSNNTVKTIVKDDTYRYNLYWYDKNKTFIGLMENKNPPDTNYSDIISIPANTAYIRVLVCRTRKAGGLEDGVLDNDSKFSFSLAFDGDEAITVPENQGEWEPGRFEYFDGSEYTENTGRYYRTGFIGTSWNKAVTVNVIDNTYRYNIYWYDKDKKFIGVLQEKNAATLNTTKTYEIPSGATYMRWLVCRAGDLGGVENNVLTNNSKISFEIVNGVDVPIRQGEWVPGRLEYSDGQECAEFTGRYFRTDFISTEGIKAVTVNVIDDSYRYNIYWYDQNKNFIDVLQKKNAATLNVTSSYAVPTNASYMRWVVCRSGGLGGVEEKVLTDKSRIYFETSNIENVPKNQGIWKPGRFEYFDGSEYTENTGRYFRTDFISTDGIKTVTVNVIDDSYRYNIYWYDNDKEFIGVLQEKNAATLNTTTMYDVPSDASFMRLLVCRSGNLGGVEDNALRNNSKIFFTYNSESTPNTEPSETDVIPDTQGEWKLGRLEYSSGEEVEELTGRYFRTDFIELDTIDEIEVTVLDDTYRYNIYWYDSNYNFIDVLQKKNAATLNESNAYTVPENAAYMRLLVCRSGDLGGVEDNVLTENTKILFNYHHNNTDTTDPTESSTQGIWETGTLDDGGEETPSTNTEYFRTGYISTADFDSMKAYVIDDTYFYNIYWYSDKETLLSSLDSNNPPTINYSDEIAVPDEAQFMRIVVFRSSEIGGIGNNVLVSNDKVYFIYGNHTSFETTPTTPATEVEPTDTVTIPTNNNPTNPVVKPSSKVTKKNNTIKVKLKKIKFKANKLKKKKITLKVFKITKAQGKVVFKKMKGSSKKLSISKKTGKITIKKGTKKGTYKLKVKITAKGNSKYKSKVLKYLIKVKIK